MKFCVKFIFLFLTAALLWSCSELKYVPDDQYLLNKVSIKNDNKQIDNDKIRSYLRQTPNASLFGWKFQVELYSLSGPDTTKRINRMLRKMGDAPEIYDRGMTLQSVAQLQKMMSNAGYYEAQVDFLEDTHRKKRMNLTYQIKSNEPYTIKSYTVDIADSILSKYANDSTKRYVKTGDRLNINTMNEERQRLAERMQNQGYYNFEKEYLMFTVDSAFNSHQAEVTIHLRDYLDNAEDSITQRIFQQYTIRDVFFHIDFEKDNFSDSICIEDTVHIEHYHFAYGSTKRDIRPKTLINHSMLIPGRKYSARAVERTYEMLSGLGPVRYADISFREVAPGQLIALIELAPNKKMSLSGEIEGTYSSGDWGIESSINFNHRNIFKGAENLNIGAHAAYEWRKNTENSIMAGAEVGLTFPTLLFPLSSDFRRRANGKTKVAFKYQWQKRPGEYVRTIAEAGIQYLWAPRRSLFTHRLDLFDMSYVYLPEISESFRQHFINDKSILRYSFENHLIMRMGYAGSYSTYNERVPLKSYNSFRYSLETAGNLLLGISKMVHAKQDEDGAYLVGKIRFSQYVKMDFDYVHHHIFNKYHRLVFHTDLGVGIPYGNAKSLPFEKRYFSGGASSNRGWSARTLGPGTYKSQGRGIDINNQTGDIKFDINLEYRAKLFWKFNGALFIDAGNIWTIRDYESQPGGTFRFNSFYKEIGLACGAGLRLDFNYFVFRVDFGMKLYDPSRAESPAQRWVTSPKWKKDDFSWHFAIGYPF